MRRIHITGNAGSGKTTLAAQLGARLDLPVFGLDSIVWQSGWKKSPPEWRAEKEAELIGRREWIIEGVSARVRAAADVIIFLDVPRVTSYLRCAKRNWRHLFHSRPDLPDDCPEILIIPRLAKIIWRFPKLMRPEILADKLRLHSEFLHIRTSFDVNDLAGRLRRNPVKS